VIELTELVTLKDWPEGTRLIVRREPLHPGVQHSLFPSLEYRYWGFYTDQDGDPVELDRITRAHAHVEQHISRLKDSGLLSFPFTKIEANRSWMATKSAPTLTASAGLTRRRSGQRGESESEPRGPNRSARNWAVLSHSYPPPPLKRWSARLVYGAWAPDQRFRVRAEVEDRGFSGLFLGTYAALPHAATCSVAPRTRPIRWRFVVESSVEVTMHRAAQGMPYAPAPTQLPGRVHGWDARTSLVDCPS
jgi:hypothetical protein